MLQSGVVPRDGRSLSPDQATSEVPLPREPIAQLRRKPKCCSAISPIPWPEVIERREAEGNLDAPDYQAATFAFYQRHFCRIVPWPDALVRSFKGMNADVYGTMWGPTEFSCTGNLRDLDVENLKPFVGPIQLTCGLFDEVSEAYMHELASRWANARLHVFPESSHSAPLEEPAAFLDTCRSFFAHADGGAHP